MFTFQVHKKIIRRDKLKLVCLMLKERSTINVR